jgi:periplasmic protein TonB
LHTVAEVVVVLKTLDKYIEDSQTERGFLASVWSRAGADRRFRFLFTLSVIFHVVLYTVIIKVDLWSPQENRATARQRVELVQFAEVAPPPDPYKRRPPPESLARVDVNRLQLDPDNPDDTRLLSRSPRPSTERGNNGSLPSADEIERRARGARRATGGDLTGSTTNQRQPPRTAAVTSTGLLQPASPVIAQAPVAQAGPAPPAPSQNQPATATNAQESAQATARRGDSAESNAFALQSIQGQYIAYVRAKILQENEAILLRDYISSALSDRVSAVFELKLKRDGHILGLRLLRSSGHPRLDARAREAIYIASPFKGYPESAGDLLAFTVTLYYFPGR